jgi:hypothetical protein
MSKWIVVTVVALAVLTGAMGFKAVTANSAHNTPGPMPPTPWFAVNTPGPMPPTPWVVNTPGPMPPTPWDLNTPGPMPPTPW